MRPPRWYDVVLDWAKFLGLLFWPTALIVAIACWVVVR